MGASSKPHELTARRVRYLGPCLTPQEVAAREQAAAVAMREACVNECRARVQGPIGRLGWDAAIAAECADRIATLPITTDALTAALAQARRDGMKEAAAIAELYGQGKQGIAASRLIAAAIRAKAQEASDE
jgi:hypothetical protein